MIKKQKKKRKTKYCYYHYCCDRDEDCLNGEDCSMFRFNPDCASIKEDKPEDFEDIMDDIWKGIK